MKYGFIITQKAFGVLGVENGSYVQCEDEVTGFDTRKEAEDAAEQRIFEINNDAEYADDEEGYDADEFSYEITEDTETNDMLVFTSPRGRKVIFDDYHRDETSGEGSYTGSVWCEMCSHCHNRFKSILKNHFTEKGDAYGCCSVVGCSNDADYYVDFEYPDYHFEELDAMDAESLMNV